jgi:hypothetical protein
MGPDGGEALRKGPRVMINNSLEIKPLRNFSRKFVRFSPNSMAYLIGSGVHSMLGVSYGIAL